MHGKESKVAVRKKGHSTDGAAPAGWLFETTKTRILPYINKPKQTVNVLKN
jgi:hypothetical protein